MKNYELYNVKTVLSKNAFAKSKNTRVLYFTLKNLKKVEEEISIFEKIREMSPEYQKYDKKRVEICEKYAEKDETGKSVIKNGQYSINEENTIKVNEEIQKLIEENKKVVEEQNVKNKSYVEMLNNDSDVVFYKIKVDELPTEKVDKKDPNNPVVIEEGLTLGEVSAIIELVTE